MVENFLAQTREIKKQIMPGLDAEDRTDGFQTIADFGKNPTAEEAAMIYVYGPNYDKNAIRKGGDKSPREITLFAGDFPLN
jgi:hypothetical protein